MKWPNSVTLIRHDTSAYNLLKGAMRSDETYERFQDAWEHDWRSDETRALALEVKEKFALGVGDSDTPLADSEGKQARLTGAALRGQSPVPDVIYVSPYLRTLKTLAHLTEGWPELAEVHTFKDERIREQEHGLALLYNDRRVFLTLHPEQRELQQIEGHYWYRFPQGENVPDVRARNRQWLDAIIRDYSTKNVLVVTHHLNILATRANLERLDAEAFLKLDEEQPPINCGVTVYRGYPDEGKNGHLKLESYNRKHY